MKLRPFQVATDDELVAEPETPDADEDPELDDIVSRFAQYRELDTEYDE